MASVKAARGGARKPRKRAQPPPRLAMLQLQASADRGESAAPARSGRLGRMALGAALASGAAIAGAAFMGGSLLDAREAMAQTTDAVAAGAGFALRKVTIDGASSTRAQEVRAAALPADRLSLWSADPKAVRARVEGLDWVERARVSRRWPGELHIEVERRRAVARWELDGKVSVIDAAGERVHGLSAEDYAFLPLVVGAGAGPSAGPLLEAIDSAPELRRRVEALVRVEGRRWDVRLEDGPVLTLPAQGAPEAVAQAARLHRDLRLLDRPIARIDLREPNRPVLALRRATPAQPEA